ncbi:AI-2E family transporter [Chitinophaga horti]|uniref:AI-2E family transporter n=1 Tax=Chitinophaga horti TaxID=2920382 RepID=A0ABY6JBY5_9BACT|nr:AI-2E family transporter [Chitinophaga horti]UYQ95709.1 AI-2E family transporter [Chitinophaga horti]
MKPLSFTVNQALLFPILATVLLYFGKPFLAPLAFAIMLAMLTAPMCRWLDGHRSPRWLSCLACVFLIALAVGVLAAIIFAQAAGLAEDTEALKEKWTEFYSGLQAQVEERWGISSEEQKQIIDKQMDKGGTPVMGMIMKAVGGITGLFGQLVIVLVVTFLLLFHKEKYEQFFLKLFTREKRPGVAKVLQDITHVSQQYLVGRLMSIVFLFVLYAPALLIIGVRNGLLLAAIASILTIVPYVGSILGGLFPVAMAAVTSDSMSPALWALAAIVVIQAVDNYFVEPYVIGGEVKLTALSTILAILAGGLVWGVAGMVLFIPMLGIARIVLLKVDGLQPFGEVIGDEGKQPSSFFKGWFKGKS